MPDGGSRRLREAGWKGASLRSERVLLRHLAERRVGIELLPRTDTESSGSPVQRMAYESVDCKDSPCSRCEFRVPYITRNIMEAKPITHIA